MLRQHSGVYKSEEHRKLVSFVHLSNFWLKSYYLFKIESSFCGLT